MLATTEPVDTETHSLLVDYDKTIVSATACSMCVHSLDHKG